MQPPYPGSHRIGGWVGSGIGLEAVEKRKILSLPGLELLPLARPARKQYLKKKLLIFGPIRCLPAIFPSHFMAYMPKLLLLKQRC
jgi:hypothetical protein